MAKRNEVNVHTEVRRIANTLQLAAEAVDTLTEIGEMDLEATAAMGFANVIRSCADKLGALKPVV